MRLLIVRHGPAGGRRAKEKYRGRDALRPLTAGGREKIARAAKGLSRVAGPVEVIATSPYARARQTAELLAKPLGASLVETGALEPDRRPEDVLEWLEGRKERSAALVGHEPQLGRLVAWLCAASRRPLTELKKGQACLLEGEAKAAGAVLVWSLSPSHLRRLG